MPPPHLLHALQARFLSRACAGAVRARLSQGGLSVRLAVRFRPSVRYISSAAPTAAANDAVRTKTAKKTLGVMEIVAGDSGRLYVVQEILQEKEGHPCRVYLATSGGQKFVLKDVVEEQYAYYHDMYRALSSPNLRLLEDTVAGRSMFVYKYFNGHLLGLAQKNLPLHTTKRILKSALQGLAALHERDIVHTDIKPDNIMIEWKGDDRGEIAIEQVQLTDIEDAAYVGPRQAIAGRQLGNYMWRSPEAHAMGNMHKYSDMFSFGIVCIYAVTKRVIFAIAEEELEGGKVELLSVVLEHQISYLADQDGLDGLLAHLGDSPWAELFRIIRDGFGTENPRRPFALWGDVEADFGDLVGGLTNFDPKRRITAREALGHRWFDGV